MVRFELGGVDADGGAGVSWLSRTVLSSRGQPAWNGPVKVSPHCGQARALSETPASAFREGSASPIGIVSDI